MGRMCLSCTGCRHQVITFPSLLITHFLHLEKATSSFQSPDIPWSIYKRCANPQHFMQSCALDPVHPTHIHALQGASISVPRSKYIPHCRCKRRCLDPRLVSASKIIRGEINRSRSLEVQPRVHPCKVVQSHMYQACVMFIRAIMPKVSWWRSFFLAYVTCGGCMRFAWKNTKNTVYRGAVKR